MTKRKHTRRALLNSVISLIICFCMLLGTTFAWFTDEVTSAGNKIQAGTLKIDLLVKDGDEYKSVKDNSDPIFNYDLWEPGYTEVVNVKVANLGSLALQYELQIVTDGLVQELLNSQVKLSDVIDVYYANKEINISGRDEFNSNVADNSLKHIGTLTDVIFGGSIVNDHLLATGSNATADESVDYATIGLKMRESAGNEYQGLSVGSKFDLRLYATQYTYEEDTFDDQYDKIERPSATLMVMEPDLLTAYGLDAGAVFMSTENWDSNWDYDDENDKVADGTPEYAFDYADFVISFDKDHAAGEVGLWGYYAHWGVEETFAMDAITAGTEYRVIKTAEEKLGIAMGDISYRQLLNEVKEFACGVTEDSLKDGETVTVTLRLYDTKLNGGTSFVETGAYQDIAVYTYTHKVN